MRPEQGTSVVRLAIDVSRLSVEELAPFALAAAQIERWLIPSAELNTAGEAEERDECVRAIRAMAARLVLELS